MKAISSAAPGRSKPSVAVGSSLPTLCLILQLAPAHTLPGLAKVRGSKLSGLPLVKLGVLIAPISLADHRTEEDSKTP